MSGKVDLHRHNAPELYEAAIDSVNTALDQDQSGRLTTLPDADSRIANLTGHLHREIHLFVNESDPKRLRSALVYLTQLSGLILRTIVHIKERLAR